jgi:hypothetical protein
MGVEREESPVSRPGFVLQGIILLNIVGVVFFTFLKYPPMY